MDWDKIADQLKEGFDDDTVKDLVETLKKAVEAGKSGGAGGPDAGELARAIGEIMGKFGAGAVGGATGVDPALLRMILELLAPLARDALGELVKVFVGEDGDYYEVRKLGGFKYAKIVKDPKGANTKEDQVPNVVVTDRLRPQCEKDSVHVVLKMQVTCQEEPIDFVYVEGMGVAGGPAYPAFEGAGDKKIPKTEDQTKGGRYEVTLTFDIPCTTLFDLGGVMFFVITVQDEDGNQMVYFFEGNFADFLLKDPCCNKTSDETYRTRLLEIIRNRMRPLTAEDLERLIQLVIPPKSETAPAAPPVEKPAPKTPPKPGGRGAGEPLVVGPVEEIEILEDGGP